MVFMSRGAETGMCIRWCFMTSSLRRLTATVAKELRHITRDVRIVFPNTLSPAFLLLIWPKSSLST